MTASHKQWRTALLEMINHVWNYEVKLQIVQECNVREEELTILRNPLDRKSHQKS
jgi:hypothetical protein